MSFLLFWASTLAARVAMRMARYFILIVEKNLYVCTADNSVKYANIIMNERSEVVGM